ncbi:hypothetical protein OA84_04745 [Kaistella solincola]|uniref:Glycosyltransferase family 1 protein n=1 Tax=Kaistella solincola TaxID=510955 RepID=A0ABR4ZP66_9FLAO|nr:glycosyltransferase family 1 protein [Kaistella solincola]KIA82881.1 hypothetical protein OA84_04745 [Kaistella solincola]
MELIRVLQVVVNMNSGGIENMLMNLYREMDKSKIQFDFLLHSESKSFFEDEIVALGGKIHRIKPLRIHNLMSYQSDLAEFFQQNSYKIVHSHISVWSYIVLNVAKKSDVPIRIAHSHEAHDSIWDHRLHRVPLIFSLKKVINRPLTHRFACGQAAGKWLYGRENFNVINNAIDAKRFTFTKEDSVSIKESMNLKNKFVFGNVGRFNTQKNHSFLLEVFKELLAKIPNAYLLLVGEGTLKESMEKYINENNLSDHVMFLGVRRDVDKILLAMDYILMPSLFEGLPVSLVEAQASGIKVFASDKISSETDFTGLVDFISIENKNIWVDHICKNLEYDREDTFIKVVNANYDVKANAAVLTKIYVDAVTNSESNER